MEGNGGLKTISGDMERQLLSQDLAKERDSDEDGGPKARVEMDSDFSLSEEEENAVEEPAGPERENWSEHLTKVRKKHNTGVKGVRADYEEAKQIMRRRNETKKLQDAEAFKRQAYGAQMEGESVSYSAQHLSASHLKKYDADEEDNSEEDDDDEDEFLEQYRQARMQQLNGFTQLPQFGRVIFVEKFAFLDEVDNADPRTFVVTHVYEDYIGACRRMNQVLEQFAAKHRHVKVLKLLATDASQTLSHRALPAFLVYRNKELVNESTVGVNEHMFGSGDFGLPEIEFFISSHYQIPLSGVEITDKERAEVQERAEQAESGVDVAPAQSTRPTIGSVNLFQSRRAQAAAQDDDDW